jgi:hypothetical protein
VAQLTDRTYGQEWDSSSPISSTASSHELVELIQSAAAIDAHDFTIAIGFKSKVVMAAGGLARVAVIAICIAAWARRPSLLGHDDGKQSIGQSANTLKHLHILPFDFLARSEHDTIKAALADIHLDNSRLG